MMNETSHRGRRGRIQNRVHRVRGATRGVVLAASVFYACGATSVDPPDHRAEVITDPSWTRPDVERIGELDLGEGGEVTATDIERVLLVSARGRTAPAPTELCRYHVDAAFGDEPWGGLSAVLTTGSPSEVAALLDQELNRAREEAQRVFHDEAQTDAEESAVDARAGVAVEMRAFLDTYVHHPRPLLAVGVDRFVLSSYLTRILVDNAINRGDEEDARRWLIEGGAPVFMDAELDACALVLFVDDAPTLQQILAQVDRRSPVVDEALRWLMDE